LQGCAVRYTPDAVAVHTGGHSLASVPCAISQRYWYDNLLRFAAKHFGPIGFRVVCGAVLAGVSARVVVGILPGSGSAKGRGGFRVLQFALNCLLRGPSVFGPGFAKQRAGLPAGSCSSNGETTTQRNLSKSHSHGL
jgi:hypothetical protein